MLPNVAPREIEEYWPDTSITDDDVIDEDKLLKPNQPEILKKWKEDNNNKL